MEYIYNYDFINFPLPSSHKSKTRKQRNIKTTKHENNKTRKQQNTTDDVAGVLSSKVGLK